MASPGKKPRDIKNLKARLGRTITPGQAGVPTPGVGSIPPGAVPTPAPGSVPAPAAAMPTPAPGGVPAPAAAMPTPAPGGVPAPSSGVPGAIAAPPFAQPAQPAAQPVQPAAASVAPPRDPFAAAAPAAAQAGGGKVTLVLDDSKVDNADIGRESKRGSLIAMVVGAALAAVVTFAFMSTANERAQYNMSVRDGKEIYAKVQEVSKVLDTAKAKVKDAVKKAQPSADNTAAVAYPEVEALVAMERPFAANEFHRRRYMVFQPNVVDDLFDYYNNINLLWDRFSTLGAKTAGTDKRKKLDESAKAADGMIKTTYGIVLFKTGDMYASGIVYAEPPSEPPAEGEAPVFQVSSSPGGRQVERTLFLGQPDVAENYNNYFFMVDKMKSSGVLGEPANLFSDYTSLLMEVNALIEKTAETQGRLLKELGKVAALEERSFF